MLKGTFFYFKKANKKVRKNFTNLYSNQLSWEKSKFINGFSNAYQIGK